MKIIKIIKTINTLSTLQRDVVDMLNEIYRLYGKMTNIKDYIRIRCMEAELEAISEQIEVHGCKVVFGNKGPIVRKVVHKFLG